MKTTVKMILNLNIKKEKNLKKAIQICDIYLL